MDQNELKSLVGKKSVEWIKDGMTVGLGTGSTVYYMVEELGRRVKDENLKITGVTTSIRTANQAKVSEFRSNRSTPLIISTLRLTEPMKFPAIFKESRAAVPLCFTKKSLPRIPTR